MDARLLRRSLTECVAGDKIERSGILSASAYKAARHSTQILPCCVNNVQMSSHRRCKKIQRHRATHQLSKAITSTKLEYADITE